MNIIDSAAQPTSPDPEVSKNVLLISCNSSCLDCSWY